ncbi:phosphotransferase family protein [Actinomycetospora endophytica]|uniref:Phosphotransferase family protein n=1 Tax=Actinomycetospora endophytica TaxID=2291215 RepID=A0ABS8PLH0_9PSEU|nr:phosphotransferase family protein [Actinomycetospora endophytica]MCD2198251.1 phosphotransferase family protein [Actinomycetospora endophytica]
MALANKIDAAQAAETLTRWLAGKTPGATEVKVTDVTVPSASGLSTETVLFTAHWSREGFAETQGMVARVAPDGPGVFPSYDLAKEASVMAALAENTDVPAPRILFTEDDPAVLGAPFLVMEHVTGQIPSDDPPFTTGGWVLELSPAQRRDMWLRSIDVLAAIHAVDHTGLGLDFLESAEHGGGLDAQLERWSQLFDWAREGQPNPTIEDAFRWLRENQPTDPGPNVLNWGDARVGNIIYSQDQQPAAVLDWEMVSLVNREVELGWWLFLMRHHTEGIGAPLPEGIPGPEETIARYQQTSGHQLADLHWYEVFAGARLASIMVRAARMMIDGGLLPPESTMALNNPASQLLASLLGLPSPTGETTSFIGNR